jgi:hypothetical protein
MAKAKPSKPAVRDGHVTTTTVQTRKVKVPPDNPPKKPEEPKAGVLYWDDMPDDGTRFKTHTNIGTIPPGTVVSAKDLGPNAQIGRLLSNGALAVHVEVEGDTDADDTEDETDAE